MSKGGPTFYRVKRGNVWYAYYYDPYGEYKGKSLRTRSEREAKLKIKDLEKAWWKENAKRIQRETLKKQGIDPAQLAAEYAHDVAVRLRGKDIKKGLKCYTPGSVSYRLFQTYVPPNILPAQGIGAPDVVQQQEQDAAKTPLDAFWDKFLPWAEQNKKKAYGPELSELLGHHTEGLAARIH